MTFRPRILLVEDESGIADTLTYMLNNEGFETTWCAQGLDALLRFQQNRPALVVLDVGLPDISGFELFRQLQALPGGKTTPMLFLTARDSEIDAVVGLELGADDYVTKPFSPRELMARIRMILRRHARPAAPASDAPAAPGHLQARHPEPGGNAPSGFQLERQKRRIAYQGRALALSRYEYGLLALLLAQPGRVFTRGDLLEQVWDDPGEPLDRTVDAHIKTLRAKLREVTGLSDCIKTLRGVGYALDDTLGLHIEVI